MSTLPGIQKDNNDLYQKEDFDTFHLLDREINGKNKK